ncbi:MAG TPA: hypothetical protein VFX49_08330, partial [Chloroflexota bacterium]|nr:hypothetical protein [Chloroflexota bacterium]
MSRASQLHALYHLARADFLERTRRLSFLVVLAAVVWLGYATTTGMLTLRVPPIYIGEPNSPWIGALMTVTATLFLGWFGFYLVKGSVSRDYQTGVGQVIAATPLSRPLYAAGKWLSNLAVLGATLLILAAAGVAMALAVVGAPVDVPALIGPLLLLALPCLALVSALAVFFDAVPPLRGGFGNVAYLFLFALLLIPAIESRTYQPLWDVAGIRLIGDGIQSAARAAHPESSGGFAVTLGTPAAGPTWRFVYDGIAWSPAILGSRLFFVLLAFG